MLKKLFLTILLSGFLEHSISASTTDEDRKPKQLITLATYALVKKLSAEETTAVENTIQRLPQDLQYIASLVKARKHFLSTGHDNPDLHKFNKEWGGFSFKELLQLDKSGWPQELQDRLNNPAKLWQKSFDLYFIDLHSLHLNSLDGLEEYLKSKGIQWDRVRDLNLRDNNLDYVPTLQVVDCRNLTLSFNLIEHITEEQIRNFPFEIWLDYNMLTPASHTNLSKYFFDSPLNDSFQEPKKDSSEKMVLEKFKKLDDVREIKCRQLYLKPNLLTHLGSDANFMIERIPEGFRPQVAKDYFLKYGKTLPALRSYDNLWAVSFKELAQNPGGKKLLENQFYRDLRGYTVPYRLENLHLNSLDGLAQDVKEHGYDSDEVLVDLSLKRNKFTALPDLTKVLSPGKGFFRIWLHANSIQKISKQELEKLPWIKWLVLRQNPLDQDALNTLLKYYPEVHPNQQPGSLSRMTDTSYQHILVIDPLPEPVTSAHLGSTVQDEYINPQNQLDQDALNALFYYPEVHSNQQSGSLSRVTDTSYQHILEIDPLSEPVTAAHLGSTGQDDYEYINPCILL